MKSEYFSSSPAELRFGELNQRTFFFFFWRGVGKGKGGNALNRAQKKDGVIKTREKNSSQNKCTFLKSFSFEWSSTKDRTFFFFLHTWGPVIQSKAGWWKGMKSSSVGGYAGLCLPLVVQHTNSNLVQQERRQLIHLFVSTQAQQRLIKPKSQITNIYAIMLTRAVPSFLFSSFICGINSYIDVLL